MSIKIALYKLLIIGLIGLPPATSAEQIKKADIIQILDQSGGELPFCRSELVFIKSLSRTNFPKKKDSSNRVSGDPAAIAFGRKLFFNPKLSGDGTLSCASCHNPAMSWGNHDKITIKRPLHPSSLHTPSLLNIRYNRWFFWDGRADSLWSQSLLSIESNSEMAGSRIQIARLIINTPSIRNEYEEIFGKLPAELLKTELPPKGKPDLENQNNSENLAWEELKPPLKLAINTLFANIGKSIAAFEETILSEKSSFDEFSGKLTTTETMLDLSEKYSMSSAAIRGLKLFVGRAHCIDCHSGPSLSDGEFHQSFLEPVIPGSDRGRASGIKKLKQNDFNGNSRFNDSDKTKKNKMQYVYESTEFRGQYKTPGLRNVSETSPYMHTGQFKTLTEVVEYYNNISDRIDPKGHQEVLLKSLNLSKREIYYLVEFLKSLTGTPSKNNTVKERNENTK